MESSSSSSSSFKTASLSRFFGRGDVDEGLGDGADDDDESGRMSFTGCSRCCCCEVEEEETEVAIADGAALEREDDGGALVIFFSVAGDVGATPLGRPLCFARSANARFMVVHGSVQCHGTIDLVVGGKLSSPLSSFLPTQSARKATLSPSPSHHNRSLHTGECYRQECNTNPTPKNPFVIRL